MKKYSIGKPAERDLDEIWAYIADDNPAAATRLIEDLVRCFQLLGRNPYLGKAKDGFKKGLRAFPNRITSSSIVSRLPE